MLFWSSAWASFIVLAHTAFSVEHNNIVYMLDGTSKAMCQVTNNNVTLLGIMGISNAKTFLDLDVTVNYPSVTLTKELLAALHKQNISLDCIALLSDLYISPAHRKQGYAQKFIKDSCRLLFKESFNSVLLLPDPFEYKEEQGKKTVEFFYGTPEYDLKKNRLIKLYTKCGFVQNKIEDILFMMRTKKHEL